MLSFELGLFFLELLLHSHELFFISGDVGLLAAFGRQLVLQSLDLGL
jgi:hypothetical protein